MVDLDGLEAIEGSVEEYFPIWRWMVLLLFIGIVVSMAGYLVSGFTGDIIFLIGLMVAITSLVGGLLGMGLGFSLGWVVPLILSLFIGVYMGNYIAGSIGAVIASYMGPILGALIGWIFSRMKIEHVKGIEYEYIKEEGDLLNLRD